jgi:polysaccharide chain length determinant protein (PEP-CTERM system associated)
MESAEINVRSLLEIISRRRWALLLPLLSLLMLAGWLCVALPRAYKGEATLLYQPRAVPKEYVQQLNALTPEDWLRSLTQRMTSRERMLALANELNLFPGGSPNGRAEGVRQAVSVELIEPELRKENPYREAQNRGEAGEVTAFKVTFAAADPAVAARGANRLAQLIIDENRIARTRQAAAAGDFIRGELEAAGARVQAQQRQLEVFKQQHAGDLPEQAPANATALATAQIRLQTLDARKTEAHEKVLRSRQRITEMVHGVATTSSGISASEMNPLLAQLQGKREEMEMLRSRYTKRHPDVVRAESELAGLERKLRGGGKKAGATMSAIEIAKSNPLLKDLAAELEATEAEYRRLTNEHEQVRQEVALYQNRLDTVPHRALELEGLTRDYAAVNASYQALLNKKLETKMVANLEGEEAGGRFKIMDSASIPEAPFQPSYKKILVFLSLMGLVLGLVSAMIFEFADDSFRNEGDAEGYLGLPVLASVPMLQTSVEVRAALKERARVAGIAAAVAAGYVISLILLYTNGIHLKLPF